MPRKKRSELTAGLFVVAGIAVLLGVVLWLGAADVLKARGQVASFYVPMAAGSVGIIEGAELTLGDGRIGKIVDVLPDPGAARCLYHARLERTDLLVRSDAKAIVVSPAVGQAKIVLMSPGDANGPADDTDPVRLTGGLDQAMQQVSRLAENLAETSAKLRFELNAEQAQSLLAKIHRIVAEVKAAAKNVVVMTGHLEAETKADDPNSIVGRLRESALDIRKAAGRIAHQVDPNGRDTVVAKVSRAAGNIEGQTDPNAAGSLMAEVRATVKEGRPNVSRALTAMANAAEKIEAYTKKDVA